MRRYICYIRRDDRLQPQETITITEEELDILVDQGSILGYTQTDIEMIALETDRGSNDLPKTRDNNHSPKKSP